MQSKENYDSDKMRKHGLGRLKDSAAKKSVSSVQSKENHDSDKIGKHSLGRLKDSADKKSEPSAQSKENYDSDKIGKHGLGRLKDSAAKKSEPSVQSKENYDADKMRKHGLDRLKDSAAKKSELPCDAYKEEKHRLDGLKDSTDFNPTNSKSEPSAQSNKSVLQTEEIRPEYKLTKAGWIPESWSLGRLENLVIIRSGNSPSNFELSDSGKYPFLKVEDLNNCNKYQLDSRQYSNEDKFLIPEESIIFPKRGAAILNNKVRINKKTVQMDSNLMSIFADPKKLDSEFIFYTIVKEELSRIADTSTIPQINNKHINPYKIPLPPLPEQKAIAKVLSTWDKAIENLTQLISEKQQKKKALMQQLLTGKKRFPRFDGEWKEVKLGNLGSTYSGLMGKSKDDFGSGKPYISYLNIYNNEVINESKFQYVRIQKKEKQQRTKYGDVFFTISSETRDEVGMSSVLLSEIKDLYLNSFCFGYRLNDFQTILPSYAAYLFRGEEFRKEMLKAAQGATRYNLSKKSVLKVKLNIPPIDEQQKIADVLNAATKEIELQNHKLDALKDQKKGLMQQLLTGKKRLKHRLDGLKDSTELDSVSKKSVLSEQSEKIRGADKKETDK